MVRSCGALLAAFALVPWADAVALQARLGGQRDDDPFVTSSDMKEFSQSFPEPRSDGNATSFPPIEACCPLTAPDFGPLGLLEGRWEGIGYSLTSVPQARVPLDNATYGFTFTDGVALTNDYTEQLQFNQIPAYTKNRGYLNAQQRTPTMNSDQYFSGLMYMTHIHDVKTGNLLHAENGQWQHKAKPEVNTAPWTIMRMGNVPHGTAFMALGNFSEKKATTTTYLEMLKSLKDDFRTSPSNPCNGGNGYAPNFINPNVCSGKCSSPIVLLMDAIKQAEVHGDSVNSYVLFNVSTTQVTQLRGGGVINTPFVNTRAEVPLTSVYALMWVVTMEKHDGSKYQLLQYVQKVNLAFLVVAPDCSLELWPHVQANSLHRTPSDEPPASTASK